MDAAHVLSMRVDKLEARIKALELKPKVASYPLTRSLEPPPPTIKLGNPNIETKE